MKLSLQKKKLKNLNNKNISEQQTNNVGGGTILYRTQACTGGCTVVGSDVCAKTLDFFTCPNSAGPVCHEN